MESHDVPRIAEIHRESFPGFFLTQLGTRFLILYYSGICAAPEGIAYVFLDSSGTPAGFVAGTSDPRGFYSRLLRKDWLRFSMASVHAVLCRPSVAAKVARAVRHPSRNPAGGDVAGLFSIGVRPLLQGTGAGRKLTETFLREAARRGCRRVFLTTDRDGNDAVNVFYVRAGFHVEREFVTEEGRAMNEYWIDL